MTLLTPDGTQEVPMLNALNEVMRESYLKDCEIGLKRWNRQIERAGHEFRLTLPSSRFRRSIGPWAGLPVDPQGNLISKEDFAARIGGWIPNEADKAFVHSLMQKVVQPGKMAAWIAPPDRGINNLPVEYEYVKLH
jgi:benzoyl-CoA 2,3-dioxygenase component B